MIPLDKIFVEFVPKIVDTNPQIFKDFTTYWSYTIEQVHEFLGRLPDTYRGDVSEKIFEKEKAAMFTCVKSPYELRIGFKPAYHLLIVDADDKRRSFIDNDCIVCPTFDVGFKYVDYEGSRRILQAGLDQFFLRQGDIDTGTLVAFGFIGKKVVEKDLELLLRFLPKKTIIESRCSYGAGNGMTSYIL
jgi:hypothetical protein